MRKNKTITIRVSDEEKSELETLSKQLNVPVSTLLLQNTLKMQNVQDNTLRQYVASSLHRLNLLLEPYDDYPLCEEVREWEEPVWQLLK